MNGLIDRLSGYSSVLKRGVILIYCICVHPLVWHERDPRELARSNWGGGGSRVFGKCGARALPAEMRSVLVYRRPKTAPALVLLSWYRKKNAICAPKLH